LTIPTPQGSASTAGAWPTSRGPPWRRCSSRGRASTAAADRGPPSRHAIPRTTGDRLRAENRLPKPGAEVLLARGSQPPRQAPHLVRHEMGHKAPRSPSRGQRSAKTALLRGLPYGYTTLR
jgi:hypothetical protein